MNHPINIGRTFNQVFLCPRRSILLLFALFAFPSVIVTSLYPSLCARLLYPTNPSLWAQLLLPLDPSLWTWLLLPHDPSLCARLRQSPDSPCWTQLPLHPSIHLSPLDCPCLLIHPCAPNCFFLQIHHSGLDCSCLLIHQSALDCPFLLIHRFVLDCSCFLIHHCGLNFSWLLIHHFTLDSSCLSDPLLCI